MNMNKIFLMLITSLFFISSVEAKPRWTRKNGKIERLYYDRFGKSYTMQEMVKKNYAEKQFGKKGVGLKQRSTIKIFEEKDEETKKMVSKKKIWISKCRKYVEIKKDNELIFPGEKSSFNNLKRGQMVYYNLQDFDQCEVGIWQKK